MYPPSANSRILAAGTFGACAKSMVLRAPLDSR
jgi:hypothetical protein